jgi:hypothetical protein
MTMTSKLEILGEISELARELQLTPAPIADGTGRPGDGALAEWEHQVVRDLLACEAITWRDEVLDAVYQALAEKDWPSLRHALVMVAAECVRWIEDGDHRGDAAFGESSS